MSLLASLLAELEEKREQLRRLNVCLARLGSLQGEFVQKRILIEDPELTVKTWHGNLANEFLKVRDEMTFEYDDISNTQLGLSQQALSRKIAEIQRDIISLQASIAAERARLAQERKESIG